MPQSNSHTWLHRFAVLAIWAARSVWILFFIAFILTVVLSPAKHPRKPDETKADDLRVYNFNRTNYASWDRKEAVKFGFEQLASSINYLFVAAAAIIAFISKMVIEPIVGEKPRTPLPRDVLMLLRHCALGCVFSIFYGFFGYLYLNKLPDTADFSIYEEIGLAQLFQLASFFVAVMLLLFAVVTITGQRIKLQEEIRQ